MRRTGSRGKKGRSLDTRAILRKAALLEPLESRFLLSTSDLISSAHRDAAIAQSLNVAPPPAITFTTTFNITNDWGAGFQAQVFINNTGTTAVTPWTLEFDWANTISTNIWDAKIVSRVGNHYTISNADYNPNIPAGGSVSFGFTGSPGNVTVLPTNYILNGVPMGGTSSNAAPTIATAASATPSTVTGTTTALSVLGADDGGEANLTYTWAATTVPSGAPTPTFSANGTNAAKNSTATFSRAGNYTFTVTAKDAGNLTTTSAVNVTVNQTLTSIAVTPASASVVNNATQQFTASAKDQFAQTLVSQPAITWSVIPGTASGTVNSTGLYTAPATGTGSATVRATSGAIVGNASVTVVIQQVSAWPHRFYAPYVDMTLADGFNLVTDYQTYGTKFFVAGFVVAGSSNQPSWGTFYDTSSGYRLSEFTQLRALGGDVMVSFGGAFNTELAVAITDPVALRSAYQSVIDKYSLTSIDFDIEGAALNNTAANNRRSAVMKQLQDTATAAGKKLDIWLTLPVLPTGLLANGLSVVQSAVSAGVNLTGVNIMAMNYGDSNAPNPEGQMGAYAIQAATSVFNQLKQIYGSAKTDAQLWHMAGVTPMIGQNDLSTERFYPADAQQLETFAVQNDLGLLAMWSANRDKAGGSGVTQTNGQFQQIFVPFTSGSNQAPTVATAAAASPNPATGTTTNLSVLGADDAGEPGLTYTWAATTMPSGAPAPTFSANGTNAAKSSTATFSRAGAYTFTVTIKDAGNLTTTSSVNVTVNQTLTSIVVSPSSASLNLNKTQQFGATARDQFAQNMTTQPAFTWSVFSGVGTINASGLYSSGATAGSASVRATSGAVFGSASVSVTNAAPTVATVASASPSPVTGTTTVLSVLGADDGNEANLIYTWAATTIPSGAPTPTFSANGTNAAKSSTATFSRAGAYAFTVTIRDAGNLTTTSSVNVTVNQTLTSITVTPNPASVTVGTTQQFAAAPKDQFGQAMSAAIVWSVFSGGGTINSSGLYTAPGTAQSAVVRATSGSVIGSANANVVAAGTVITINANQTLRTINTQLLGTNATWWQNELDTPQMISMIQAAGLKLLRIPGGSSSNDNLHFNNAPPYAGYKTAQILAKVIESAGADGMITLNYGTGSPQEAAAWLAYYNGSASSTVNIGIGKQWDTTSNTWVNKDWKTAGYWASLRAAAPLATDDGLNFLRANHPAPFNFTYWEVGNENYATWENDKHGQGGDTGAAQDPATYAQYAKTFNDLARQIDADIKIGLDVTTPMQFNLPDQSWTDHILQQSASRSFVPDFLSDHVYVTGLGDQDLLKNSTNNPSFTGWLGVSASWQGRAQYYRAALTTAFGAAAGANTKIMLTEFNSDTGNKQPINLPGALWIADSIGGLMQTEYDSALQWDLTNSFSATAADGTRYGWREGTDMGLISTGNGPKPTSGAYVPYPAYFAEQILSKMIDNGDNVVSVSTNSADLSAYAVKDPNGHLELLVINKNAGSSITGQFNLTGFNATGAATLWQYGKSEDTAQSQTSTGASSLTNSNITLTLNGSSFNYTFPSYSMTVMDLANVVVANQPPTVATPAAATPSPANGTTTALSVLGADDGGEANLVYTWAATTAPAGAATPTFSTNGTNAAKNFTATFSQAGAYTFTVTIKDAQNLTITSSVNVTVNQTLTSIVVSPSSANLNLNKTQAFTASGRDQFAQTMASQPAITWTVDAGGVGSINASGTYSSGATAGPATVRATSGAVSGTATVTVSNAAPTVATAAAATPSPVNGTTTLLSVLGADDGGESNLIYTWAATTMPSGAPAPTFNANGTNTAKSSTATFSRAGAYTFTVTIKDGGNLAITSAVNVTVNQTLTSISVSPASASVPNSATQQFAATAKDQFGQNLASQPAFTWSVIAGTVAGTVSGTGLYTAPASGTGTATVRATSGGINGDATVTVTAVVNNPPTVATAASATPNPVTGTTTALSVLGADDGGEANLIYTWAATTVPSGAPTPTFSANGTNAAKNSTATFSRAGAYTFTVTIKDAGNLSITSPVNVTVNQTLTSIVVSPTPVTLNLNKTQSFGAVARDQFAQNMASQPAFTWSVDAGGVGSITSAGVYSSGATAGTATVRATSGISGTASVTVSNAAPTVATAASATPSLVTGTTTVLSVLGADDGGESNLIYTWTATTIPSGAPTPTFSANGTNVAKSSTATFSRAGAYTLTVTIKDGGNLTITSAVNVTVNQTLTSITVSPGSASVVQNGTQQFAATAKDQFGQNLTSQPAITWTVDAGGAGGTVNASGLYTAPASGTGSSTVRAANGAISGTASVTVTAANAAPTVATAASATPSPVTGTTTALSVLGADDGGEANLIYIWAATTVPSGAPTPTFSTNGTNAAKNSTATFSRAGAYTFTVTIKDAANLTITSAVNVTVNQALTTIDVSPATASVANNATQQFAATAKDQFGQALTTQPSVTWTVVAGTVSGTVSATGLYTAPASGTGSASVRATNGAIFGSAAVTVTAANTLSATAVFSIDNDWGNGYQGKITITNTGATAIVGWTLEFDLASTISNMWAGTITNKTGNHYTVVNQDYTKTINPGASVSIGFTASPGSPQPPTGWLLNGVPINGSGGGGSNTAPTVATAASANPTTVTGTSTALSVLGADSAGEANLIYTWAATTIPSGATAPAFNVNGTNAARSATAFFSKAGAYTFTVTIRDAGNLTVTSSVNVTVNQTLTSIAVTPASVTLTNSATQQFAASAKDQFGAAMASQPSITWSVVAGTVSGTVSASGLYTAPASGTGTASVRATSGALFGSASITVSTVSNNKNYAFANSMAPNQASADSMVASEYATWKSKYVTSSGAGGFLRVQRTENGNDTVSEGIAYGMLLAAYNNDRTTFNGLWNYAKSHFNAHGVMHWHFDNANNRIGDNGATDADEDMAYALLVADKKWGGYSTDATTLINNIMSFEVEAGTFVLKPGDMFGGSSQTNPSYFAPAFFKAFAAKTGDTRWNSVVDRCYAILAAINQKNGGTGLVPDWCDANGNASSGGYNYSYDATRTPLRIAQDAAWFGDSRAIAQLNLLNAFFNGKGVANIKDGYSITGSQTGSFHNAAFVAPAAAGAIMSSDANFKLSMWNETVALTNGNYYNDSLRMLALQFMSGNMQPV